MEQNGLDRRDFVRAAGLSACATCIGLWPRVMQGAEGSDEEGLAEVMFYKPLGDDRIECGVCPKRCRIADQERGYCGNKENREGKYYTLVHSRPCAVNADPIEKKPFFHVLPGSLAFSIAAAGCNFECQFCQNWQIAQFRPEQVKSIHLPPAEVARRAKESGCKTIAYTYSEPVTFYEYMYDTAVEGEKHGVRSVVVTNGYINEDPLRRLCDHVAAVKVDLKAFTERFYKDMCKGELKPVRETLVRLVRWGIWTEIVVLILPTQNDSPNEIREMAKWVHGELSPHVPIHFTRFHPSYKIQDLPPTPVSTLERCQKIAQEEGLKFVYVGNVPGHAGEATRCPQCGQTVMGRVGFRITTTNLKDGRCGSCGHAIPGVWV
jgi:pyruvate formate lyase activating enzyme